MSRLGLALVVVTFGNKGNWEKKDCNSRSYLEHLTLVSLPKNDYKPRCKAEKIFFGGEKDGMSLWLHDVFRFSEARHFHFPN